LTSFELRIVPVKYLTSLYTEQGDTDSRAGN
jgi:hypothetical protein